MLLCACSVRFPKQYLPNLSPAFDIVFCFPSFLPSFFALNVHNSVEISADVRMMADYDVQMCDDGDHVGEFYVKFHGPKGSSYIRLEFLVAHGVPPFIGNSGISSVH